MVLRDEENFQKILGDEKQQVNELGAGKLFVSNNRNNDYNDRIEARNENG